MSRCLSRRARTQILAATLSVSLLGACARRSTDGDLAGTQLSHVHGMAVNPTDGDLYIASHQGLFRLDATEVAPIGTSRQDTMGFTIVGADEFLASGHPDFQHDTLLQSGMRPLLGLIRSSDGGRTWTPVSLQGDADFHALTEARGLIYGADATNGLLRTSTDGVTWETRAHVELATVAASPTKAQYLVGADFDAVTMSSDDAGRTWQPVPGAPAMAFVSWDAVAGLWGLTIAGTVYSGNDEGLVWMPKSRVPGDPAALLAHPTGLFAATSAGIYESTDAGTSWTPLLTFGS